MNADEYLEACLKTWTTEWTIPQQVAHAAMTLMDEWHEVQDVADIYDAPMTDVAPDELADELGDVMYGLVIMQYLVYVRAISGATHGSNASVDRRIRQVHALSTKYWRSKVMDYYSPSQLSDSLAFSVMSLTDELHGYIRTLGFDPHELAAANAAKLAARHDT